MRVLFVTSEYVTADKPLDGVFFRDQALALVRSGVHVDVVFWEPRSLRTLSLRTLKENHFQQTLADENGVRTFRRHGWNPLLQTKYGGVIWTSMAERLADRYLERIGRPDVIHGHQTFWGGYLALRLGRKYRIPTVITEHSSRFLMRQVASSKRPYAVEALTGASCVAAVSSALKESLRPFVPDKNVIVVPNMVDTDYFSLPKDEPATKPFIFTAVALLTPNKGIDLLIRAFAQSFSGSKDFRLQICGGGPELERLVSLSQSLGVGSQVDFLGTLSRTEVRAALWRSHALVVSSYFETFSVVLVEALATGIPVLATRSGGPEDIVTPDVGQLVAKGDVNALAKALLEMTTRTWSRAQLRDHAVRRYSNQVVAARLQSIYADLIADSDRSAGKLHCEAASV